MIQQLENIIEIAIEAGDAIMTVYNSGNFDVETKSDESPLTRADIAANDIIVKALKKMTPDIPILSEESSKPICLFPIRKMDTTIM